MITPTICAALDAFQRAANRGTAVHLSPELVQALRDALQAKPEGEGPSCADLLPAEPPNNPTTMAMQYRSAWREGVEDGWNEARTILAGLKRPSTPPAPEPGEQPVSQPYKLPESGEVPSDELMEKWKEECRRLSLESDYVIPASSFMAQRVVAWARQQQATALAALRGMPVALSEQEDAFMGGVCAALATVTAHGDSVIWREIVRSVGIDNALNYAANVNPEDWDLAGFSKYAQSELGKDKPQPAPQAGEVEA